MKIIVDEDLPKLAASLLCEMGHDAKHVTELGLGGAPDTVIASEAARQCAVLVTADVGFGNLQAYPTGSHPGIVLLRFPDHFRRNEILNLVRRFFTNVDLSAIIGALVIVSPGTYRIRR